MPDTDWESSSQRVGESMLSHATSAAEVRKQQRSEYASESQAGLDSHSEQERLSCGQKYMTKRPLPTYAERLKEQLTQMKDLGFTQTDAKIYIPKSYKKSHIWGFLLGNFSVLGNIYHIFAEKRI